MAHYFPGMDKRITNIKWGSGEDIFLVTLDSEFSGATQLGSNMPSVGDTDLSQYVGSPFSIIPKDLKDGLLGKKYRLWYRDGAYEKYNYIFNLAKLGPVPRLPIDMSQCFPLGEGRILVRWKWWRKKKDWPLPAVGSTTVEFQKFVEDQNAPLEGSAGTANVSSNRYNFVDIFKATEDVRFQEE